MCMVVLGLCSPVSTFGWLPRAGGGLRLKGTFSAAYLLAFLWRLGLMSCSWHPNLTDVIPPTDGLSSLGTHQGQWSKADVWGRAQKWSKHMMILFQILSQEPAIWGSIWETTRVGRLSHSLWESSMTRGLSQCLYINAHSLGANKKS